jgi:hypothetical protein
LEANALRDVEFVGELPERDRFPGELARLEDNPRTIADCASWMGVDQAALYVICSTGGGTSSRICPRIASALAVTPVSSTKSSSINRLI